MQYLKHITGMNMPVIWLTSTCIASAFKNTKNTKTKYNYRYKLIINFPISSKAKRNDVLLCISLIITYKAYIVC